MVVFFTQSFRNVRRYQYRLGQLRIAETGDYSNNSESLDTKPEALIVAICNDPELRGY